jgi:hypothetical protein
VLVLRLTVCDPGGAKASSGIQKIPFSEEKLLEAPHARLVNPAQSLNAMHKHNRIQDAATAHARNRQI